jgi:rhodanese-related sulfurtransferase
VARQLIALGFDAAALQGGYAAWRAAQPVEPKTNRPPQQEALPSV